MKKAKTILLPPFIGSFILTAIAYYDEKIKDTSDLEPCEIFELSTADFLIILIVLTTIGAIFQFAVIEKIFKRLNIHRVGQWIKIGFLCSTILAIPFTLLIWSEKLGFIDFINTFLIGFGMSAIYMAVNLLTVSRLTKKSGI